MQQLMVSFAGKTPPPEILAAVRQGDIASFCLFTYKNVVSPGQLRDFTDMIYRAAAEGGQLPPLIGIDQEGGQLIAITNGATELPGNMALGATRSAYLAEQAGMVLGRELLAMGINMNFAPSLDVNTNPANPVVGIRSFGEDPRLVGELGMALARGMQAEGVLATVKHFPGHGDTEADSHRAMPIVPHSMARTSEVELVPFRIAIAEKIKAIMTGHVLFSALDNQYPVTLSELILDKFLRHELHYDGLIVTDAMDMYAVAQYGHLESVRTALKAGADLVMLGHIDDQLSLFEQTRDLLRPEAVARIEAVRREIPLERPSLSVVGCAEHQTIAQNIADASITVVRDTDQIPLKLESNQMVAVITTYPLNLTPADTSADVKVGLSDAVRRRHSLVQSLEMTYGASDESIRAILQAVEKASVVIVGTIGADKDASQANLIKALYARGQNPIVIALRTPYDIMAFPMIETYICTYGIRAVTTEAVARVLFGEIEARGILPCAIPGIQMEKHL